MVSTSNSSRAHVAWSPLPLLILACSALLAIQACGGGERAAAPPAPAAPSTGSTETALIDACALLPYSEAEAIAGEPLRRMATLLDQPTGADFAKCAYGNPKLLGRTVSLEVRRHETAQKAAAVQEASRDRLRSLSGDLQPVPGLGDAAFWADGRFDQLHALLGDLRIIVTVTLGAEADRRDAAESVARATLHQLAAS